jgi:hypothetical protein
MDREPTVSQRTVGTGGVCPGLISTQNYRVDTLASLARLLHALALAALRLQPRRKGVVRCMFCTLCGVVELVGGGPTPSERSAAVIGAQGKSAGLLV